MDEQDEVVWGEIEGRRITFPMAVERFDAVTLSYPVDAAAARALLPGDAFEVVEADGLARFVLAACDYHENPWGDYLELNLGFLARPVGADPSVVGSFVYRMPVDQPFTCRAGNEVLGFPKTVEDLSVHRDAEAGTGAFAWHRDGALVLRLAFPAVEPAGEAARVATDSYSYLDGVPHATALDMDLGTGIVDPAQVVLELGEDPVADELRGLGLPRPAELVAWGTDLTATFQLGRPL